MKIAIGALMMTTVTTAGCAVVPPAAPAAAEDVPVHGAGRCNATLAQGLIGRNADEASGGEAMRLSGATVMRWLRPGDIVTMEFREDRLNIHLDARGRILRIVCG